MRIPGDVKDGVRHFKQALADATALTSADRGAFVANALKELGFYYRNVGLWGEADKAYQRARDAISENMSVPASDTDRKEMASIQTNWAYVKGLVGSYREGTNLVESAIAVRRSLGERQEEGISWSVCGEVYRYERRFQKAWHAYTEAEQIFQELRSWSWLGLLYQEQAICLYQAAQDEITIALPPSRDPIKHAKLLITLALDICRDQAVRGYPSALNRAGRIFGRDLRGRLVLVPVTTEEKTNVVSEEPPELISRWTPSRCPATAGERWRSAPSTTPPYRNSWFETTLRLRRLSIPRAGGSVSRKARPRSRSC